MNLFLSLLAAGTALFELGQASKLTPPVLPLTVRTPYLSTWLGDARISPWNKWPMFWTGNEVHVIAVKKREPFTDVLMSNRLASVFLQLFQEPASYILYWGVLMILCCCAKT